MKELAAQSLVVDAVRAAGGAAHKMSHRFLTGVADLSVKLPTYPLTFAEVKIEQIGRTTRDDHTFKLGVTPPQEKFLQSYRAAGAPVCVLSFVERGGLGRRGLWLQWFSLDKLTEARYVVAVRDHVPVPLAKAGEALIVELLKEAASG